MNDHLEAPPEPQPEPQPKVVQAATDARDEYRRFFTPWNVTGLTLGILSIVASSLASAIPKDTYGKYATIVSAAAAVLTAVYTFLKADSRARVYITASTLLERALTTYSRTNDALALEDAIDT